MKNPISILSDAAICIPAREVRSGLRAGLRSSPFLRASAARSRPMSFQARQWSPIEDRPAWTVQGSHRRPVTPASSGHGALGSHGGASRVFLRPFTCLYVRDSPREVHCFGVHTKGYGHFRTCPGVSFSGILTTAAPLSKARTHTTTTPTDIALSSLATLTCLGLQPTNLCDQGRRDGRALRGGAP
jgi:hypothetical protein